MNNGDVILVNGVFYLVKIHSIKQEGDYEYKTYVMFIGLNKIVSEHIELDNMPNESNLLGYDLGFGEIRGIYNRSVFFHE